jgi:hypothetical protein
MKESDLTPEWIAENIFEWIFCPEQNWNDEIILSEWNKNGDHKSGPSLPTFKEPEWTGPLLEIANKLGNVSIQLYSEGTDNYAQIYRFNSNMLLGRGESQGLNYAIILAIAETKGL